MIYIETDRLLLRGWKDSDKEPFGEMNSDPAVMKHFLRQFTAAESAAMYDRIKDELAVNGYGLYALERREDGAFIGFTGFREIPFEVDFAPGVEIDWRLRTGYHGNGYATEAASACLEYARRNLPFATVWSFTSLPNKPSERVMNRIGMKKEKEFPHPSVPQGHPLSLHVLYRIDLK